MREHYRRSLKYSFMPLSSAFRYSQLEDAKNRIISFEKKYRNAWKRAARSRDRAVSDVGKSIKEISDRSIELLRATLDETCDVELTSDLLLSGLSEEFSEWSGIGNLEDVATICFASEIWTSIGVYQNRELESLAEDIAEDLGEVLTKTISGKEIPDSFAEFGNLAEDRFTEEGTAKIAALIEAAGNFPEKTKERASRRTISDRQPSSQAAAIPTEIEFNTRFGDILSHVSGQPEEWMPTEKEGLIEGSTKRPDILLDRPGLPPFAVEAKFSESPGDPVKDIAKKLGQKCSDRNTYVAGEIIKTGAALRYPPGAKEWSVREMEEKLVDEKIEVEYKLASLNADGEPEIFPEKGWIKGDIYDFWGSISRTALNTAETKKLGAAVAQHLKNAATSMLTKLKRYPDEQMRIAKMVGETGSPSTGMDIACVVWLDALLMMNELHREQKELNPNGDIVKNTAACRTSTYHPQVSSVLAEWNKVLADNYASIFRPAKNALPTRVLTPGDMSETFGHLFKAVEEIESARLGKIANVGGEIFARAMDEAKRKDTASFYTKPQIAEFLAAMAIPSEDSLPANWKDWKLGDFACGTGSLLRSGYRRMQLFADKQGLNKTEVHKHMMENGICGLDVSPMAAHLSATTIVNLMPGVSYENMQIGAVNYGTKNGETYAGALELSDPKKKDVMFNDNFTPIKGNTEEGVSRIEAEDESFAAVVMNPPYRRIKSGQDLSGVSEEERNDIRKRLTKLRKHTLGKGRSGVAPDFLSLAFQKLASGGRMGFVLPLTMASAGTYREIREHLLEHFSDVTVVFFGSGLGTGGESLSDDTNLNEMMLIATKNSSGRKGVRYVKLDDLFPSASHAMEIARAIWSTEKQVRAGETKGILYIGKDRVGEWLLSLDPPDVWGLAGTNDLHGFSYDAELLAGGRWDTEDSQPAFPIVHLHKLFDLGSSHIHIGFMAKISGKDGDREGYNIGAFRWHEIGSSRAERSHELALWHADHTMHDSINVEPTHYGTEYDPEKAEQITSEKTDMFIQRNIRWNSQQVLVGRTKEMCFGGASWTGLSHPDPAVKDAFTIWSNSIFGFISYWSQSQRQQQGRSQVQISNTGGFMVPNFANGTMRSRVGAVLPAGTIDNLFDGKLERTCFCEDDPHRQRINKLAADLLGIPDARQQPLIDYLQRAWTEEPSVTPR